MTKPYFYIIQHKLSGKKYVGSRRRNGCDPKEFMKIGGYTTSSKYVNSIIEKEGLDSFSILELIEMDNPYEKETDFLIENNCAISKDWFNLHNNNFNLKTIIPYGSTVFKDIMLLKYGFDNAMKIEEFKLKQKRNELKTLESRYSVKHNSQIPAVREKISKYRIQHGLAKGENNPCYGLFGENHPASGKRSEETIAKMRENCGKWERSKEVKDNISIRQKEASKFVKDNPMNDPNKRKLVSLSKIGRKKFVNKETNEIKMCIPGDEPLGFVLNNSKE